MKKIDIIGFKFGRLTVISENGFILKSNKSKQLLYKCLCDCGNEKNLLGEVLRDGRVKSCGCIRISNIKKLNLSHGMSNTSEYKTWQHIKYRCYNENSENYSNYGGRGIRVCDEWINSFEQFYKDMGKKPNTNFTIDRKDVNGDYTKLNCRWVNDVTQANNKRNTKRYLFREEMKTMSEISDILKLNYKYFWKLFKVKNLSLEEIEKMVG